MNNMNLIDLPTKCFRDIDTGTYKVLIDVETDDNNETATCYLILKNKSKSLAYRLNNGDSNAIFVIVDNLKFRNINYSEHYYRDYNIILKCNNNDKTIKVSIKIKKKQTIILCDKEKIHNLKPNTKYIISNFTKSPNKNRSTIISKKLKYYIDDNVINILVKYFKCEDNDIYCLYNSKKEKVKLTLITENRSCFNSWNEYCGWNEYSTLRQSLEMQIGKKKFSFYVNNPKFIDFDNKEEGKYRFLVIYFKDRNIFAYEHKEDKYYCIKDDKYKKEILKNIDQAIAEQYKKGCNLNVYTYLLLNNEKRGLIIKDKSKFSERYRLSKLSRVFQTKLDITLVQRG